MNLRPKILLAIDLVLGTTLVLLELGSAVCFGGAVWWFRPAAAFTTFLLAGTMLVRLLVTGRSTFLKSPLTLLGLLLLAVGTLQLVPLPPRLAQRISPTAHQIYSYGVWPERVNADDSTADVGEPARVRSPLSLDRSATLRWLVGAAGCLGIFWVVSHFTDRLRRLYLVWGSVVAAFLLNGAFGLVQIAGQSEGLFGTLLPGRSAAWAPALDDLLDAPTTTTLRRVSESTNVPSPSTTLERIALVPDGKPFLFGTMIGGSGGFLALGSLALPLSLAILLHVISPRGSRESFSSRLAHTGQGSFVVLLIVMLVISVSGWPDVRAPGSWLAVRHEEERAYWRSEFRPCSARVARVVNRLDDSAAVFARPGRDAGCHMAEDCGRAAAGRTASAWECTALLPDPRAFRCSSNSRWPARVSAVFPRFIPTSKCTTPPRPRP